MKGEYAMNLNKKAKYWFDLATEDIEVARVLLGGEKMLYAVFMCHLSIEKGLKAVIANTAADILPPKTHDLVKLAKQSGIYSKMDDSQKDFLEVLLPLNIEARYPSYKDNITASLNESSCREILDETEALLKWINQAL